VEWMMNEWFNNSYIKDSDDEKKDDDSLKNNADILVEDLNLNQEPATEIIKNIFINKEGNVEWMMNEWFNNSYIKDSDDEKKDDDSLKNNADILEEVEKNRFKVAKLDVQEIRNFISKVAVIDKPNDNIINISIDENDDDGYKIELSQDWMKVLVTHEDDMAAELSEKEINTKDEEVAFETARKLKNYLDNIYADDWPQDVLIELNRQLANNDINTELSEQETNTLKEDEVAVEEVKKHEKKAKSISEEEYVKLLEKSEMWDNDVEDLNLNQEETEINMINKLDMDKWVNDNIKDSGYEKKNGHSVENDADISVNQSDVNYSGPLQKKLLNAFSSIEKHKL